MKEFCLIRLHDLTGISGVGRVAEGVVFEDERAVMRWMDNGVGRGAIVIHETINVLENVHGHEGKTKIIYDCNQCPAICNYRRGGV